MKHSLILVFVFGFFRITLAEMDYHPISPDEPVSISENTRFSIENSLLSIKNIQSALYSFVKLTEVSVQQIDNRTLRDIGNTDWEIQNLAFKNWSQSIEGTLYKYQYLTKKLEYELEIEKSKKNHKMNLKIENARQALLKAEKEYQSFWESLEIYD